MKKKLLSLILAACVLLLPVGGTALAAQEEPAFQPGDVPAASSAAESMLPAIHGVVLAVLNHETSSFTLDNGILAWEGLYNMLSLYGQLDSRSSSDNGELFLPEETVQDYASALEADVAALPALPAELWDRINYDNVSRCYVIFRGEDDQAGIQVDDTRCAGGDLILTVSLVSEVDGQVLTGFQAVLQPRDNMFGWAVTALTVTG